MFKKWVLKVDHVSFVSVRFLPTWYPMAAAAVAETEEIAKMRNRCICRSK